MRGYFTPNSLKMLCHSDGRGAMGVTTGAPGFVGDVVGCTLGGTFVTFGTTFFGPTLRAPVTNGVKLAPPPPRRTATSGENGPGMQPLFARIAK